MPLLELIGPPAVGKTTLVADAVRQGARDARRQLLRARHPLLRPVADRARRRPTGRRTVADRLLVPPGVAAGEAALADVADDWRDYLDLVLAGLGRPAGPSGTDRTLAVMERGWLLEAVRLRALLEPLRDGPDALLLDEGLTHPYKVHAAVGPDLADVERYAQHVPLPDVLVVIDADRAALVARLLARRRAERGRVRWAALPRGGDADAVAAEVDRVGTTVATVATIAERRGGTVVRIDTSATDPSAAVRQLLDVTGGGGRA